MAILSILLTVVIVAVSILIVLIVLLQRPKQEGLGAAFGGGTLDSALGAHTTDVLQKMTSWLGVIFFVSAIGLAMIKAREFRDAAADDVLEEVDAQQEGQTPALPSSMSHPGQEGESGSQGAPMSELPTQGNTLQQGGSTPSTSGGESVPGGAPSGSDPLEEGALDSSSLGGDSVDDSLLDDARIDGVGEGGDAPAGGADAEEQPPSKEKAPTGKKQSKSEKAEKEGASSGE